MPEIVDIDELVPDDIVFKYRKNEYTIPGDLRTDQTLELYGLLRRLANAEAKGTEGELKRIIAQTERALLPIFQVHQPDLVELPFGAAGLGHVLRRVLTLIGLIQIIAPGEGDADPPMPAPNRAQRRRTPTATKPGSQKPKARRKKSAGSSRSKS